MNQQEELQDIINYCWDHFKKFRMKSEKYNNEEYKIIYPSIPILYFGDYKKYINSKRKIITVGLNPSNTEFPLNNNFTRFRGGEKLYKKTYLNKEEKIYYLNILNQYFNKTSYPYKEWFKSLDYLLQCIDCSYYSNLNENFSLHTDLITPLATKPTWSKFKKSKLSKEIKYEGIKIWHKLIKILKPDIVLMSFSKKYLNEIKYINTLYSKIFYTFMEKDNRKKRRKPFNVILYKTNIDNKVTYFIFGNGQIKPFLISNKQKYELGKKIENNLLEY